VSFQVVAVEPWQHAELREHLEAVADADDELPVRDEPLDGLGEAPLEPVREHAARGDVVAEREATDDEQDMELVEPPPAVEQVVQMHLFGHSAGQPEGARGLRLAVQPEPRDDQHADVSRHRYGLRRGQ